MLLNHILRAHLHVVNAALLEGQSPTSRKSETRVDVDTKKMDEEAARMKEVSFPVTMLVT